MATSKKQPAVKHAVVKTEHGDDVPVSIIPIARSGRPDFVLTTTYPVTSELTWDVAAHAAKVEVDFATSLLKPKQLRPYYER